MPLTVSFDIARVLTNEYIASASKFSSPRFPNFASVRFLERLSRESASSFEGTERKK